MKKIFILAALCFLSACATVPPKNIDNICSIFSEKSDWYEDSYQVYTRWGVPIPVQMAIMYQESSFRADAQPPRPWLLGFIPWFRSSSAFGYAQAKDETWADYISNTGNSGADRDDFTDATDFIGWYCAVSEKQLGIPKTDAKNLYLAYHEGHGGFKKRSYLKKGWLQQTANKVANRAQRFQKQLSTCRAGQ